jgi:hypothetical protein
MLSQSAHSPSAGNSLVVVAGYPKSGNTLMNDTLSFAGQLTESSWCPPRYEWQNQGDIDRILANPFNPNPYLRPGQCHIKTHLKYSEQTYALQSEHINTSSFLVITRNPFDTLLSATNYLRFSAIINKSLTGKQEATLKHFYPGYTVDDILKPEIFNLEALRDAGALDQALEVFSSSQTSIPQFLARSGTWIEFYASFKNSVASTFQIRFEDIVKSEDGWQEISKGLASFLDADPQILNQAFARQREACEQAKEQQDPFYPVADSYYFFNYFQGKTLRRFCNTHKKSLEAFGYSDLADRIFST